MSDWLLHIEVFRKLKEVFKKQQTSSSRCTEECIECSLRLMLQCGGDGVRLRRAPGGIQAVTGHTTPDPLSTLVGGALSATTRSQSSVARTCSNTMAGTVQSG